MRLPLEIVTKEPRTINARMRPKVTERGQATRGVWMKERSTVPKLVRTPAHQADGQSGHEPGREQLHHGKAGSPTSHQSISRRADNA